MSPAICFSLGLQCESSCGWVSIIDCDWLVTLRTIVPLLQPWAALGLADGYCSPLVLNWVSLLMPFPPAASVAPSDAVKADQEEEVFNYNSSLIFSLSCNQHVWYCVVSSSIIILPYSSVGYQGYWQDAVLTSTN